MVTHEATGWRWFDARCLPRGGHNRRGDSADRRGLLGARPNQQPRWPKALRHFAEPSYYLHDARIRLVQIDPDDRTADLAVEVGRDRLGDRRLQLHFRDAEVVPPQIQSLEMAVTAEFHREGGSTFTDIIDEEIDEARDGRFVLRLRLWPFHEFAIELGAFEFEEETLPDGVFRGPGRFVWVRWESEAD